MLQQPDELKKLAAVGTKNSPSAFKISHPAVEPLLGQKKGLTPEIQLMLSAGIIAVHRQLGYLPQNDERSMDTLRSPCEKDARPLVKTNPLSYLTSMINGQFTNVLREWLIIFIAQKRRLPEEWLPRLLYAGTNDSTVRPYIVHVLGTYGEWLVQASDNEDWEWANTVKPANLVAHKAIKKQERYLFKAFVRDTEGLVEHQFLHNELSLFPHSWTIALTDAVIGGIHKGLKRNSTYRYAHFLGQFLMDKSLQLHPSRRKTISKMLVSGTYEAYANRIVTRLDPVLRFREGMLDAFRSNR